MKLAKMGEDGWVALAKTLCASRAAKRGIGDDAAVLAWDRRHDLLVTADMLLEGRHFRLDEAAPYEIGRKAMGVNLSDIAAMGGEPTAAVVSLGLPAGTDVKKVKELYRGLLGAARRFGASVVGGDTNASAKWTIAVTLLGRVEKGRAVLRSGARPGERIFVSGVLGGSYASKKHLCFTPRVREARWLSNNFKVGAMMDLSDGLAADLPRLCAESRAGAVLDERMLPRSRGVSVRQALGDGEDFELLFTLSAPEAARLARAARPEGFPSFTHVGWITRGRQVECLRPGGRLGKLALSGFDHFR